MGSTDLSGGEEEDSPLVVEMRANFTDWLEPKSRKNASEERHQSPKRGQKRRQVDEDSVEQPEEEEWFGFGHDDSGEERQSDYGQEDEGPGKILNEPRSARKPEVVVFGSNVNASTSSKARSTAQMKAFMSSKVTKLSETIPEQRKKGESSQNDDDLTNLQNDALLHRLVHTKILSGSLDPELDLTPAQRRKALAGRVMEAAGRAKLGRGEASVRSAEHRRAAKHIRDGIMTKNQERAKKALDEAKNAGIYHPTLKQLYESSDSNKANKKRERGLRMGVGTFGGGVLKLSRQDLSAVQGDSRGRPSKRGRR